MTPCRWLLALILGLSLASASPARADTPPVSQIVSEVQTTYQGVTSVRANFLQTIKNPLTGKEEKKSGRIMLERPRKMRIEVGLPLESAVVSDGATLWIYAAQQKQVIVQKETSTGGGMGVLLDDLGRLSEMFTVTVAPETTPKTTYTVTLVPKTAGQYKSVQLTLTKQRYVLQQLVLVDQMDGRTVMDFSGVMMGGDVPDSTFSFKAPTGTTVVDASKM